MGWARALEESSRATPKTSTHTRSTSVRTSVGAKVCAACGTRWCASWTQLLHSTMTSWEEGGWGSAVSTTLMTKQGACRFRARLDWGRRPRNRYKESPCCGQRSSRTSIARKLRAALDVMAVAYRDEDATQNLASGPVARTWSWFPSRLRQAGDSPGPLFSACSRPWQRVISGVGSDPGKRVPRAIPIGIAVANVKQRLTDGDAEHRRPTDHRRRTARHRWARRRGRPFRRVRTGWLPAQQQIDATNWPCARAVVRWRGTRRRPSASFSRRPRRPHHVDPTEQRGIWSSTRSWCWSVENQTLLGRSGRRSARPLRFVGISRAKRRLYLTVYEQREQPEGARYWKVARAGAWWVPRITRRTMSSHGRTVAAPSRGWQFAARYPEPRPGTSGTFSVSGTRVSEDARKPRILWNSRGVMAGQMFAQRASWSHRTAPSDTSELWLESSAFAQIG